MVFAGARGCPTTITACDVLDGASSLLEAVGIRHGWDIPWAFPPGSGRFCSLPANYAAEESRTGLCWAGAPTSPEGGACKWESLPQEKEILVRCLWVGCVCAGNCVNVGIRNFGGLAVEDCLENCELLLSFGKCLVLWFICSFVDIDPECIAHWLPVNYAPLINQ